MTNHLWAQNAADCAVARSHQFTFGSRRQQQEFTTFGDLIILVWRRENHPAYAGLPMD